MTSAWHCEATTVRLVALLPAVEPGVPTLITCRWKKIVIVAILPALETVAITDR